MRYCILILTVTVLAAVSSGFGQEKSDSQKQIEELRREIAIVHAQLDSLRTVGQQADDMDEVEARLDDRITALESKVDAVSRSMAPIAFNPKTVAVFNFAARSDSRDVVDKTGQDTISNRMFLRTMEIEMSATVDPYAEAITVVSLENQAGQNFGIDAEEAYGLIKRLPILQTAPLGLKIKLGKFRAPLGVDNKIHMHDLPWTTRPLIISNYLGTDHGDFFESGFNPVGMDLNFYVPNPIPATTLEMDAAVVRSGDLELSNLAQLRQPAYLGHLNLSRDWNNEHLLNIGASAY
ncbi:MAG TPA: hypothetical protein VKS81_10475, partial [Bacteroidota bacterium]|nr:hypothetical protein [Bacteroidota bacterium]